jgi:hypothetical protein
VLRLEQWPRVRGFDVEAHLALRERFTHFEWSHRTLQGRTFRARSPCLLGRPSWHELGHVEAVAAAKAYGLTARSARPRVGVVDYADLAGETISGCGSGVAS